MRRQSLDHHKVKVLPPYGLAWLGSLRRPRCKVSVSGRSALVSADFLGLTGLFGPAIGSVDETGAVTSEHQAALSVKVVI